MVFKVPDSPASAAARRRKKVKVLEEEEYIDRVEAIIGIGFINIGRIPILLILEVNAKNLTSSSRKGLLPGA